MVLCILLTMGETWDSTVVQRLARGLSVWSLHNLPCVLPCASVVFLQIPQVHPIVQRYASGGVILLVSECEWLSVLALWQAGNLSRMYPASYPMAAGIGSSCPMTLNWLSRRNKMDGYGKQRNG